jgi:2-polyprenyl-3-methyl-5-hydroxy-6-metoxy-1,4-benzoquinol methylase
MKRRANTVNAVGDDDESKKSRMKTTNDLLDKEDAGHRRGNFHNYYSFHPSSLRMKNLKAILEYIGKHSFTTDNVLQYCDLGCNEGDLTIKIASALQQQLKQPIHFVGIDMDPVLIERAKTKEIANESVTGDFYVENICEHKSMLEQRVDVTSLLSTTMWIHIHAGDEGLKSVLEKICERTKQYILIEPQPSKWYVSLYCLLAHFVVSQCSSSRILLSCCVAITRLKRDCVKWVGQRLTFQ